MNKKKIPDMLDYINWRGDLSFEDSAFNDIDAAILCQILYLNFDGFFKDSGFKDCIKISELSERFINADDFKTRSDTGVLINKQTVDLLKAAGKSKRFSEIKTAGYISVLDLSMEEQFSAITYIIKNKTNFVAYRGTDDNIVGWKEDFNLAIHDIVPSQKDAQEYLKRAARNLNGVFYIGGHSKGGNLAVYAAAESTSGIQKRIQTIYNFDGPGFTEDKINSPQFKSIIPKILSFHPQLSIVGMLFNRAGKCLIVKSFENGIMQHDMFSWTLLGKTFIMLDKFEKESEFFNSTVNTWINGLDIEKRKLFIDTVFDIIASTNARTNTELEKNIPENSIRIISAVRKLDPDVREAVRSTIFELFNVINRKLPEFLFELKQNFSLKI